METVIAITFGVVLGYGAGKLHPRVNGGMVVNVIAGAIGGLIGARVGRRIPGQVLRWIIATAGLAGLAVLLWG